MDIIEEMKVKYKLMAYALDLVRLSKEGNMPDILKESITDAESYLNTAVNKLEAELYDLGYKND